MFGTSGAASGHNRTLLPATSVSPASASASPLFHLPTFVSQSADHSSSSAVLIPSSVIVPPQPQQSLHQICTSSSTSSSVEATATDFGVNPLMNNLIASLTTLSRPHPIVTQPSFSQNGFPLINEIFQNSLAECLRHSSSTPNVKTEFSLRNSMDNITNGNTTTPMPNANLLNVPLSMDHLNFAHQKSPSSVELLQRALEAFAVVNQSKMANNSAAPPAPSVVGNPLISTPLTHSQTHQFTSSGTTAATPMSNVEQQLLSLLNFTQLSSSNTNTSCKNDNNLDTFCPFSRQNLLSTNGICLSSSTVTATTTTAPTTVAEANAVADKGNKETDGALAKAASAAPNPSVPIDLSSNQPQQQPLLLSSAASVPRGRKSCDIRRSASSVSYKGNADVHEHFQRTFSGKWPRRQPSLRAHLQASGGRAAAGKKDAALCIGENAAAATVTEGCAIVPTEEPMEEEEEEEGESESAAQNNGTKGTGKRAEERAQRPKSRQQAKSVYSAVIRKLFTNNEVKQVEDHFRKSLGEDRFLQIKNEQQRKQRAEKPPIGESEGTISRL